jgi:subtilase family serine protease
MLNGRRKTSAVALGGAALLCLTTLTAVGLAPTAGAASASRRVLAGSEVPALARQHPLGAVAKSSRVDFELVLQLRNAKGAQALVKAVSTPGGASYRHYLTASQWESKFSPSLKQVSQARGWLHSEGFKVGAVSKDRITISASGTAGQVEQAFGTRLENYRFQGHTVRFATSKMSVPAAMASSVVGAMGINENIATPASATSANATAAHASASSASPFPPAPAAFITSPPCGTYLGQKTHGVTPAFGHGYPTTVPDEVCGYKPGQLRSAYHLGSSDTGQGVTVAVIDAYGSATITSDLTKYFKMEAPSEPFSSANFAQEDAIPFDDQSLCAASGWLTEQAIDLESVHAMAPGANILYVGAQDCVNGLFSAEQTVIDNGQANVVTNSWGDDAGDLLDDISTRTAYDDLFMLADSTGMSILFSSGDNGDNFNLLGASSADYPPSSPLVTAVGGTSLEIGSTGQQTAQYGWATGRSFLCTSNAEGVVPGCSASDVNRWLPVTFDGGSGGFTSYDYLEPWYQNGVVPVSLALRNEPIFGPVPLRVEPDISMDADPSTGLLLGLHETFPNGTVKFGLTRYGGTSLASPLLAGVLADVDQTAGAAVGFINPAIYRLDSVKGAIDDIRPGGKQAMYRTDFASSYGGTTGTFQQFREVTYEGVITYCDGTGNCASRPNTLTTAKGYDSMTGLGSIGRKFVSDLAAP